MADVEITKFGNIEKGIDNGVIAGNLEIVAEVLAQVKALAPVAGETSRLKKLRSKNKKAAPSQGKFGGTLRNSYMYVTPFKTGGFNDSSGPKAVHKIAPKPRKFEAYIGSALNYAIYQEFGTRKMAPQPHVRPAIALVVKGQSIRSVIKKIQFEEAKGPLKEGQTRVRF